MADDKTHSIKAFADFRSSPKSVHQANAPLFVQLWVL